MSYMFSIIKKLRRRLREQQLQVDMLCLLSCTTHQLDFACARPATCPLLREEAQSESEPGVEVFIPNSLSFGAFGAHIQAEGMSFVSHRWFAEVDIEVGRSVASH